MVYGPGFAVDVCCMRSCHYRFKKANRTMTTLLKVKGENAKRNIKVEQMQKAAVNDSDEDEGIADQMEVTARQQADALQAEEGDPEPVVLQQVLFHTQVSQAGQSADLQLPDLST